MNKPVKLYVNNDPTPYGTYNTFKEAEAVAATLKEQGDQVQIVW